MGKKLDNSEIVGLIRMSPQTTTFDSCSSCNGIEIGGSMQSKDPDDNSADLICDECLQITNPSVLKFWCESSYDHEDTEREHDEWLVIAVDMGEEGTKTIGEMRMANKDTVETLLSIINIERFGC